MECNMHALIQGEVLTPRTFIEDCMQFKSRVVHAEITRIPEYIFKYMII